MITGFNPADMYAADHIRRVLETFPGVFSGIGEFTIHKEFVSAKIAGDVASLTDPALDRILDFAGEVGLRRAHPQRHRHAVREAGRRAGLPDADEGRPPAPSRRRRSSGRTPASAASSHPVQDQATTGAAERSPRHVEILEGILEDPGLAHVHFDISWDEVAKYVVATPASLESTAALLNRFPTASCSAPTRSRRPTRPRT